jgi:hypothetical protein
LGKAKEIRQTIAEKHPVKKEPPGIDTEILLNGLYALRGVKT